MGRDLFARATMTVIAALIGAGAAAQEARSPATEQPQGQSDDGSLLTGEIVVTAQRRQQNAQDVGITINTFSGEQLRELGVRNSTDIAAFTPGVHLSGNIAGQNQQVTIRGVTQNDFNDIVEAPNAAYLDEGYLAVAQAQTFAVFDIQRVEILKGPQGTLFGRNATGGLVHYISNKPSLTETQGFVDVAGSLFDVPRSRGGVRVEAGLGAPLSPTFAVRGAILYNQRDPVLINLYPQGAVGGSPGPGAGADMYDDETLAGRFTALWEPTQQLTMRLAFNGARTRFGVGPYQQKPTINVFNAAGELIDTRDVEPGETRASIGANGQDIGSDLGNTGVFGAPFGRPRAGGDFFGYIDPDGADFLTSSDFAFSNIGRVDTWGVNFNLAYEITPRVTLTAISDYKKYDKLLFIDVDSGPGNQAANYAGVDAYSFTQEVRLNGRADSLDWTLGLYYLRIDSESDNGLKFPVGSVVPGAPFDVGSDARLRTDSYSAFGQVEWKFAPRFNLVVGGRVIQEEKDYAFSQNLYFTQDSRQIHQGTPVNIGPVFGPGGPQPFADKLSETLWAGKVQLEYQPNSDLLLYVGVNRGVKAGSFNAQLAGGLPVPPSFIPYNSETLVSYEGGLKYTFLNGRGRFNVSGFYYDYSDYQSFLFTGVSGVVINADSETYGAEAEIAISPIRGLDLSFNVSAFDATVKDVPLRVGGPISRDVNPTYAPELQTNSIIRYQFDALGGRVAAVFDAQTSSSYFYNLRNFTADRFDPFLVANFGLSWSNVRFRLGFDVKNATDERVGVQGFNLAGLCGCNEVSYRLPRQFMLSARYSY